MSAYNSIFEPVEKVVDNVVNTGAQAGRIFGGVAQGTVKTVAAPLIAAEQIDAMRKKELDKEKHKEDMQKVRGSGVPYTQSDLIDKRASGEITQKQYDNTINSWRAGENPADKAREKNMVDREAKTPITDAVSKANTSIQKVTDKAIEEPKTKAAEWVAKGADAVGEAIPTLAIAAVTGGSNILAGTALSHASGAANAFTTELIEGSGNLERAALSGATEWGAEALGGKLFNGAADNISNKALSWGANAASEGLEEVISGVAFSSLTGDSYGIEQAAEDFALGTVVGGVVGAGAQGLNAARAKITEGRVGREVNARIGDVARADVADVQALLAHAEDSAASAVVAQDSLEAIKKQTANPVNTKQVTSQIPADIAQKYNLVPVSDNTNGKPIKIKTQSYEGIVEPQVSGLTAQEVSLAERASINPAEAAVSNPRALYQYADDIYLRPGTDIDNTLFTYRGQANQFYRTSQEAGSIPASGEGTSWEGSGVYSAPDPYTTDLYGPSGKLPDNPLSNKGIPQKSIDVDYPVGVILQQPANISENASPLTRTDAPDDVVEKGTRRVRYDDKSRGLTTEVINNPSDISAAGLTFGRTGVADATPIQYAAESTNQTENSANPESIFDNKNIAQKSGNEDLSRKLSGEAEQATGEYIVPDLVKSEAVAPSITQSGEREEEYVKKESVTESLESSTAEAEINEAYTTEESPADHQSNATPQKETGASSGKETPVSAEAKSTANPAEKPEVQPESKSETQSEAQAESQSTTSPLVAPSQAETQAADGYEAQTAEELAEQIWTPAQLMEKENRKKRKRKREKEQSDFNYSISRGQGATGEVYETTGYNSTFTGLSSY